jgi:hypothetical protein
MIAGLKGLLDWRHGKNCQKAEQCGELPEDVHELLCTARDVLDSLNAFADDVILCALERDPDWLRRWHTEASRWSEETQVLKIQEAVRRTTGALWPTSSCDPLRGIHWEFVVAEINNIAATNAPRLPESDDSQKAESNYLEVEG